MPCDRQSSCSSPITATPSLTVMKARDLVRLTIAILALNAAGILTQLRISKHVKFDLAETKKPRNTDHVTIIDDHTEKSAITEIHTGCTQFKNIVDSVWLRRRPPRHLSFQGLSDPPRLLRQHVIERYYMTLQILLGETLQASFPLACMTWSVGCLCHAEKATLVTIAPLTKSSSKLVI